MKTQLLSVVQLSSSTGVSRTTIYRKIQRGLIPSVSVAGQIRIPIWYLEELTKKSGELPNWLVQEEKGKRVNSPKLKHSYMQTDLAHTSSAPSKIIANPNTKRKEKTNVKSNN